MTLHTLEKFVGMDGLRQIGVHASGQAAGLIAFHRVGGHGDNPDVRAGHQGGLVSLAA
jgi:hypothetical protein